MPQLPQIEAGIRELTKLAAAGRGEARSDDASVLTLPERAPTSAA